MSCSLTVDKGFLVVLEEANIFQSRFQATGDIKYINRLHTGDIIQCEINTGIEEFSTFAFGKRLFSVGSFSSLASTLPINSKVGRYTSLAGGAKEMGYRHPVEAVCMNAISYDFGREHLTAYMQQYESISGQVTRTRVPTPQPQRAPIMIGNDVWIGANVTIAGGVTIGNGAVIASNSVVTKDVAPYSLVAGLPAKHKKYRFPSDIIEGIEATEWWKYELGDLYREGISFADPQKFINKFRVC